MGKIIVVFILLARSVAVGAPGPPQVAQLLTNYSVNPLGIDTPVPLLSWQLHSDLRDVLQSGYQIRVTDEATSRAATDGTPGGAEAVVWDSGRVNSPESILVAYAGAPLKARHRYSWQVRVWDGHGAASNWSEPAHWEMGLLSPADWSQQWIEPVSGNSLSTAGPVPVLRRDFQLHGRVRSARAYVTSHGLYEMYLNGRRVGDQVLAPGWTSYNKRLAYQTFDVTPLLKDGANAVGALLGDGWYRGRIGDGEEAKRNSYGDRVALLFQLEVTYTDGHTETLGSGGRWKSATGPILMSEIYAGETYDARLERSGWSRPGYDDRRWSGVRLVTANTAILVASPGPPVRRVEQLTPTAISRTPSGETVVDMGQNMVGWVRLKVKGRAGTTVTLRHAEVLDRDGNIYTKNLGTAEQTVRYTLKGGAVETYEPHFTFQGFRYVAVDGYPGALTLGSLTGIVVHSDLKAAGEFETSNRLLNQLQHNIVWGQKGNFIDIPTDCPQRDERLGWTGDAQVFAPTAAFNTDVAGFFAKWLADLAADQYRDGQMPDVIPNILEQKKNSAAGWGDAATVIPWTMYLAYGDTRTLAVQYPSMAMWVDYERSRAGDGYIWDGDTHYGDWLDFFGPAKHTNFGSTSTAMIATAYFAHSTDILRRAAQVLGKEDEATRYAEILDRIKNAFRARFVSADGVVAEGTQTAYVLALDFDLLTEAQRPLAAARLAQDVRERGHLTTGFLGTPRLLAVLSHLGYLDEAYTLLNRTEFPSWLYPVNHGATTIWERWDGRKPDGSFEDASMNSFNHYAYGSVGQWMYSVIAGLDVDPMAPGYRHFFIQPQPGGALSYARASHLTPYGLAGSAWELRDGRFELAAEVPPSTSATVRLPHAELGQISEGGRPLSAVEGIHGIRQDHDDAIVEIGSGRYSFSYPAADR